MRATVVLPVPGLPVKTRWRLVVWVWQTGFGPEPLNLQEVGDYFDLALHSVEADQTVELCHQFPERPPHRTVRALNAGGRNALAQRVLELFERPCLGR